jgi:hypothetical protein
VAELGTQTNSNQQKSLSQLKTADDLVNMMKRLREGRNLLELKWKLNLAFYKGRQYSYISKDRRIQSLPTEEGDKPRYRVRLTSNQIITGTHSLLSKYTKTKPIFSATPASGSQSDLKAAQMAESLFEYWWDELQLTDKLDEALLWTIITGQGYWKVTWDPYAAKQMRFILGPNGQPILDDTLKEAFTSALSKQGVEPKEKIVYLGDVKVEAPSPFDVFLDPVARVFDDARYVICRHNLDPDEVWARWQVKVTPDSSATAPDIALPFASSDYTSDKNVRCVYVGYFKPTPSLPNGRYVVWIENPNQILEDKPWPYPTHDLPIVKFPGLRSPGEIYDGSYVEHAIPLQKELNRTLSQIVEYKNLTIKPRVWAPTGSVRTRLTAEPGGLYEYNPIGGFKPEIEKLPSMPPYVFEHLSEISGRLKEVFALTEVSTGNVPPNVEAGIAIDLLQELSADRLAPTIKLIEKGIARGGQLMLTLGQKYYVEPRLLKIRGSGGSIQVKRFTQADIAGGVNISVETGSGLPRTRAGRQAQIERWIGNGIIPADKAWKYLDIADLKGLAAQAQVEEDQAYREIEKIIQGVPINPEKLREAQAQVQSGVNPQTQQPFASPEEAQQFITDAAFAPLYWENYDVHLDVLANWMDSAEFEAAQPDVRQRAISHWTQTLQAKLALPTQAEPGKVNTNFQIKATVGPTTAAKLLAKDGISVTPEEMAEPPLETWVSDSVDKPDTDAAGPGQEAQQLSEVAATVLKSQVDTANAAVAAQISRAKEGRAADQHTQAMSHAEQLHQERMNQERAKTAAAKRPPAAPKKA